MKFTCEKSALNEAINVVQKAVSSKAAIPALEGILLEASGSNTLKLSGYDLEIGIDATVDVSVEGEGSIVLNARILGDIVRKLPSDLVVLETDEKMLCIITCGMAQFTILGTPSSDFPEIPKITGEKKVKIRQDMLKKMVRQTGHAISSNDSKPVFTGSLFDLKGEELRIVSVDGFRLAICKEIVEGNEEDFSFVVPGKTLAEVAKIMGDTDEEIQISLTRKHIVFEMENFLVISRLLEGEFLNYENAIPKEGSIEATINVKQFMESVDRASLLINERMKSPLRLMFDYDTVKLSCTTPLGKVYDEFKTAEFGASLEIGFNNRYVMDALKACEEEEVTLQLGTPLSPMVMTPVEGDAFLFLILPVRLKND